MLKNPLFRFKGLKRKAKALSLIIQDFGRIYFLLSIVVVDSYNKVSENCP